MSWPSSISLLPQFPNLTKNITLADQRRIVNVDTSCCPQTDKEEMDAVWVKPHSVILREVMNSNNNTNNPVCHYEFVRGSLWHAAKGILTSFEYREPTCENLEMWLSEITHDEDEAANDRNVFLQRKNNFRRYSIVYSEKEVGGGLVSSSEKHRVATLPSSATSPSSTSASSPSSGLTQSQLEQNRFFSPSRSSTTFIVTEKSDSKNNSIGGSGVTLKHDDDQGQEMNLPAQIDDDNDESLTLSQHQLGSDRRRDGDDESSNDNNTDDSTPIAGANQLHSRKQKGFSQAIAFEFVQDVIGSVIVQRSRANTPAI